MATNTTPTPDPIAVPVEAPAVEHDRAVTKRQRRTHHGYPFRIYEGQVEALVDGAWVIAEDSTPV